METIIFWLFNEKYIGKIKKIYLEILLYFFMEIDIYLYL